MLERGLRVTAFAGLLFVALSCGKTIDPPAGTNTNWLGTCEDDGDCRNGNDCICGVCTRLCSAESQCAALDENANCTPVAECGGSAGDDELASQSACLLGCSGDGDCRAIANGECRDGVCLPRITIGGSAGTHAPPPDAGSAFDPYALVRADAVVEIGAAYLDCKVDEDCSVVGIGCNGCCQYGAIEEDLRSTYDENFAKACAGYRGIICDCQAQPTVAKCIAGTCRTAAECVSPTQNSQRAYDIGAMGCPCDQPADSICIGRVGLVCAEYDDGWAWIAVEDGPCEMRPIACTSPVIDDPAACLAVFTTCRELPDGGFCGEGCTKPLDCDVISCAGYTPLENPTCQNGLQVYEGLCDGGKLRYRSEGGNLGGILRYWDASSGALLAEHAWTDTNTACDGKSFEVDYGDRDAIARCQADEQSRATICP